MNDETRNTMTSTEAENLSSLPEGLQDDELSRRYYLCGFAALPWLWIVHTLHWYGKQRRDSLAALLRDPNDPVQVTQEHVAENEHMWVKRCRNSALLATVAWVAWVLIIQVFFTSSFPSSWFVRQEDSYEATGW